MYFSYGLHISRTSYVICHDSPTVKRIFSRLRNWGGKEGYPDSCGGYKITHIRDVTTGYDSSQPNHKCVSATAICVCSYVCMCISYFYFSLVQALPVMKSSQMITFTFQNGLVATLRTSGTEPKIKYYAEICAPPGNRLASVAYFLTQLTIRKLNIPLNDVVFHWYIVLISNKRVYLYNCSLFMTTLI